jgi:hypothetical protein
MVLNNNGNENHCYCIDCFMALLGFFAPIRAGHASKAIQRGDAGRAEQEEGRHPEMDVLATRGEHIACSVIAG